LGAGFAVANRGILKTGEARALKSPHNSTRRKQQARSRRSRTGSRGAAPRASTYVRVVQCRVCDVVGHALEALCQLRGRDLAARGEPWGGIWGGGGVWGGMGMCLHGAVFAWGLCLHGAVFAWGLCLHGGCVCIGCVAWGCVCMGVVHACMQKMCVHVLADTPKHPDPTRSAPTLPPDNIRLDHITSDHAPVQQLHHRGRCSRALYGGVQRLLDELVVEEGDAQLRGGGLLVI